MEDAQATLKGIARKLDLSIIQVSRAVNDHSDMNEETRLRVWEAARAMNHQPNVSARKLVSGRPGMVGLVVPQHRNLGQDGIFMEVVPGFRPISPAGGMQFVLHIMREDEPVLPVYQALAALGLPVSGDVSVLAHDDLLPALRASAFFPALTVTKAPLRDSWEPLAGAIESRPLAALQRIGS
ncbi:LacI family DNA-binding transcriptional regulator [Tabrizicola sp. YIM 78059]|uniref:LacI family DNA-binding transcriptional regulator n=1 Tax=Tabrizicola sp. YIM 78059 TaxID=2529861 RepID=UPI00145A65C1|nr:LacI family DNA-binding transcriptional regulator [Tabrizicola sp. YIM 78059]